VAFGAIVTLSLDLRQRIVSSCDKREGTQEEIAKRYKVSFGMVRKLLLQRRKTGCIKARHHLAGRKKLIVAEHRIAMRKHLKGKPDMTLAELREALGLQCTLPAIHYVLEDMGLTYKKRRSAQPSRTVKTSASRGDGGSARKAGQSPGDLSFLMRVGREPT
jgi:transposase